MNTKCISKVLSWARQKFHLQVFLKNEYSLDLNRFHLNSERCKCSPAGENSYGRKFSEQYVFIAFTVPG